MNKFASIALLSISVLKIPASAQWTTYNLHPKIGGSSIYAISGSGQFGLVSVNNQWRASAWEGSSPSWTDFTPAGNRRNALIRGAALLQQVGTAGVNSDRACLWNGSQSSFVDLHPATARQSFAVATNGTSQVGYYYDVPGSQASKACLWNGSAGSFVNWHPVGAYDSDMIGFTGTQPEKVAGNVRYTYHRAVIFGPGVSNLPFPGNLWRDSYANGASGSQVVGAVSTNVSGSSSSLVHAVVWNNGSFVDIHPSSATSSDAVACYQGLIVGNVNIGGVNRASFWTGTSASWTDLSAFIPSGWTYSTATCVYRDAENIFVGGIVSNSTSSRGALWKKPITSGSWEFAQIGVNDFSSSVTFGDGVGSIVRDGVRHAWIFGDKQDLSPAGSTASEAKGAAGTEQVGISTFPNGNRASLWSGSASSWVDLTPPGSTNSEAWGIGGGQQVGFATVNGVERASIWTGSAASRIDLHPEGASSSIARKTSGSQQVGSVVLGGARRASLWSGDAASRIDLHPNGAISSEANALFGLKQVGYANIQGADHAGFWMGTAGSWFDLHPAGASRSVALGLDQQFVVGYATIAGVDHACMWEGANNNPTYISQYLYGDAGWQTGTWTNTRATSITRDAFSVSVSGFGTNQTTGRDEAWSYGRSLQSYFSGSLYLEIFDTSDRTATFFLRDPNGVETILSNLPLEDAQSFNVVTSIIIGTYRFGVRIPGFLTTMTEAAPIDVALSNIAFGPINGDADGDNEIGPGDFERVVASFGLETGSVGFDDMADVDRDHEVGPGDFEIIVSNFGNSGD